MPKNTKENSRNKSADHGINIKVIRTLYTWPSFETSFQLLSGTDSKSNIKILSASNIFMAYIDKFLWLKH